MMCKKEEKMQAEVEVLIRRTRSLNSMCRIETSKDIALYALELHSKHCTKFPHLHPEGGTFLYHSWREVNTLTAPAEHHKEIIGIGRNIKWHMTSLSSLEEQP
jgi:hypothetical protein